MFFMVDLQLQLRSSFLPSMSQCFRNSADLACEGNLMLYGQAAQHTQMSAG